MILFILILDPFILFRLNENHLIILKNVIKQVFSFLFFKVKYMDQKLNLYD